MGMAFSEKLPVLCVLGATGTGKSDLALHLARKFGGAIINLDSRQVYTGLPLVTAQPSLAQQALCPHFLYGFLPLPRKITAGVYARLALGSLSLCRALGWLPVLTGGTGLYLNTLLQGIAPIAPIAPDITKYWQMRLEAWGARGLHEELAAVDPDYAAKISCNDKQRITRALEVYMATGKPFSWWHKQPVQGGLEGPVLKIGLRASLQTLEPRLQARIGAMLEQGAMTEVAKQVNTLKDNDSLVLPASLHSSELPRPPEISVAPGLPGPSVYPSTTPGLPGLSSIGCPEICAYLRGQTSLDEACELWLKATRAYAKRQITWFNKDREIIWLDMERPDLPSAAEKLVTDFLKRCA